MPFSNQADKRMYLRDYRKKNPEKIAEMKRRAYVKSGGGWKRKASSFNESELRLRSLISRAYKAVRVAVRDGILSRPGACEICGTTPIQSLSGLPGISGHHQLGYDPEHWLDVVWVCGTCHRDIEVNPMRSSSTRGVKPLSMEERNRRKEARMKLGREVYALRTAAELTQNDVAIALGVSRAAVSAWEHGASMCPEPHLAWLREQQKKDVTCQK